VKGIGKEVTHTYNWQYVILKYMGWITAKCGQVTEQQISDTFNLKCQK
jgi:hypothetical protein